MHDGPSAFSIELAGTWAAEGAKKLEQDWQSASAVIGRKELIVDLSLAAEIDPRARQLLLGWFRNGATNRSRHSKIASIDRVNHWVRHSFNHPQCLATSS
jgi:hypothetical protein